MEDTHTVIHPLSPIWSPESRILILGTMPSPRSRQEQFYYAHPQNRFWPVLARVFGEEPPQTQEERRDLLFRHRIALWDVLEQCQISGASDSSIRDPQPNDILGLRQKTAVKAIFTTGSTAWKLYRRLCESRVGLSAVLLPSTSPANARFSLEALVEAYQVLREYTE